MHAPHSKYIINMDQCRWACKQCNDNYHLSLISSYTLQLIIVAFVCGIRAVECIIPLSHFRSHSAIYVVPSDRIFSVGNECATAHIYTIALLSIHIHDGDAHMRLFVGGCRRVLWWLPCTHVRLRKFSLVHSKHVCGSTPCVWTTVYEQLVLRPIKDGWYCMMVADADCIRTHKQKFPSPTLRILYDK